MELTAHDEPVARPCPVAVEVKPAAVPPILREVAKPTEGAIIGRAIADAARDRASWMCGGERFSGAWIPTVIHDRFAWPNGRDTPLMLRRQSRSGTLADPSSWGSRVHSII